MTYKPNFNTNLPWPKMLELLNELLKYEIDSSSSNDELEYILIEINDETKNLICNLGIDLSKWEDDFYRPEKGWFDITVLVWGGITFHYGQDIWYTGEEFIAYDEEKRKILSALKETTKSLDYMINSKDADIETCLYEEKDDIEKYKELIAEIEGDDQ